MNFFFAHYVTGEMKHSPDPFFPPVSIFLFSLCKTHGVRGRGGHLGDLLKEGCVALERRDLQVYCLHVPIDGRDVIAREHARLAVARTLPPVRIRVVQDLDEIASAETQLSVLLRVKVEQGLHVRGVLHKQRKKWRHDYEALNTPNTCNCQQGSSEISCQYTTW